MKKIIAFLFAIFIAGMCFSQQVNSESTYSTAVGVKIYPGAISVKHFTSSNIALEGLGYLWQYGFRACGLYEIHKDINVIDGLKWYVGPGAHVGFYNQNWTRDYPTRESSVAIGIDGVLGLDYKIPQATLNLSIDWQPSFNLIGYNYFEGGWGGLSVRYTF